MANDRQANAEPRIQAAIAQLLGGDIPDGLKCDVKSLCVLAGVPRATLYRTYPHLKAEFDHQRHTAQDNGQQPDPRLAHIDRCKTQIIDLRLRLAGRDREISELKLFRGHCCIKPKGVLARRQSSEEDPSDTLENRAKPDI
jgi:hypothetical protein